MAYNTPESVADYLSRFQMQVTERTKGTFSPMHVKYSLALKMGSSSFETTFQSNPNVHGEPTVTPPIARPTPLWSSTIPRRMPHASRAVSSSLATT